MAISDLLPRKAMGSKTRGQTLQARIKYDQKEIGRASGRERV